MQFSKAKALTNWTETLDRMAPEELRLGDMGPASIAMKFRWRKPQRTPNTRKNPLRLGFLAPPPRAARAVFRSRSNSTRNTKPPDAVSTIIPITLSQQVDGLTGRPRASNSALIRSRVVFTNCELSRDGNLSVGRTDVAVMWPVVVDRPIGDITSLKKCRLHAN
jgi:hypothetical protein